MKSISTQLLKDCRNGDRKAQLQLYKVCFSMLMGICMRYKREESEAVASLNMGFLKIITNLEKYSSKIPFQAWAKRIMINTLIDEYRKYKKERETISYTDFESPESYREPIDFNAAEQKFDAQQIEAMIHTLPPMNRQVFNLFAIDGYSHKEIAQMLGISEGTSKWHLSTARNKLKQLINQQLNQKNKLYGKRISNG